MSADQKYRPDVDGLRTIAVLSVVFFHLHLGPATGGFTGVDVFFVISGYLITGHVHREVVEGKFSILTFYERRIRRIYPALLATMAATFIAAWFIFMPDELRDLGSSMVATVSFASNLLFWMQIDYFAGPVDFKPLIHTWSLAVEEQFYIVIPPLIYAVHKWRPQMLKPVVAGLAIASFAASCLWVAIDPSGNYYLPHTRAWELLIGSAIALGIAPRLREGIEANWAAAVGLALVMAPIFLLSEESVFPAWNALATCIGTALLILSGQGKGTIVSGWLSNRLMVGIGLISYSLYLVHWPLIVFAKYVLLRDLNGVEKIALMAAMVLLAWLSWRYVERPFRDRKAWSRQRIFATAIPASLVLGLIGGAVFAMKGVPQRFGDQAQIAMAETSQTKQHALCFLKGDWKAWQEEKCFLAQGKGGPVTLLWGDSHANHYRLPLMDRAARFEDPILFYGSAGCPPILDHDYSLGNSCRENSDHTRDIIRKYKVKRVVLSAYWQRNIDAKTFTLSDVANTVAKLRAMGTEVYIIGDNPDFAFANPAFLGMRLSRRDDPDAPFYTDVRNDFGFNARLAQVVGGTHFYDPLRPLCRDRKCLAYSNGQLMMMDNAHLSAFGAGMLLDDMRGIFR